MQAFKYFLIGFKNSLKSNFDEIKQDYPIYDLWQTTNKIENKFKAINEKTKKNIKRNLYSTY